VNARREKHLLAIEDGIQVFHSELAGSVAQSEGQWADNAPNDRGRWGHGGFGGGGRSHPDHPAPALLGAQDSQCVKCASNKSADQSHAGLTGHRGSGDQGSLQEGLRGVLALVWTEVSEGAGLFAEGSGVALDLLSVSGRAWAERLHTTNRIETTFGTIRHPTARTKGWLMRNDMLHMMFKLGQCEERT